MPIFIKFSFHNSGYYIYIYYFCAYYEKAINMYSCATRTASCRAK